MVWVIRDPKKKPRCAHKSIIVVWVPGKTNSTPFSEAHYKWEDEIEELTAWQSKGDDIYLFWLIRTDTDLHTQMKMIILDYYYINITYWP